MRVEVHNRCSDFDSYRAARVKSLFNAETGANFDLVAELPIDDDKWKIGLIVGPSGSGKTSMGRRLFGDAAFYAPDDWPSDKPIIDAIAPRGDFDAVTGALANVGLGSVPTWLRPYPVLSNGEKFRANLARVVCESPATVVIDEFTSVVDRQIAKFGALAFQKAWRRTGGKCVLLSCHYDIIEWVEPDWVFDTATGQYAGRSLWRRPKFTLDIWQTDWRYWHLFEPHHYLKLPNMVANINYVGTVDGELVSHLAVSTRPGLVEARACRLVIMPEWQGAGVGLRFLNAICALWLNGENKFRKPMPTLFHTSHPGLCQALRRDKKWVQVSAALYGGNRAKSTRSINRSAQNNGWASGAPGKSGYGGHFRAVQGVQVHRRTMKIFLAGQKAFGAAVFDMLLASGHDIAGVSAPLYRDDGVRIDRLRTAALDAGVDYMPAGTLRADTLPGGVDLIISAHSYDFIGRKTRLRSKLGAVGYHPSLLPLHRGRDAIRWAIHMGDRVTGGTVYWLDDNVDAGPVAARDWCFIRPGDDAETLWRRDLFPMGVRLLNRVLDTLAGGVVVAVPQDNELATWQPSWGRPPLYRPDLPMLGAAPSGYRYVVTAEDELCIAS